MNFIEDSCAWHSCKGKHVQSRDRAERPNVNGFHTPQPTGIALRQNTSKHSQYQGKIADVEKTSGLCRSVFVSCEGWTHHAQEFGRARAETKKAHSGYEVLSNSPTDPTGEFALLLLIVKWEAERVRTYLLLDRCILAQPEKSLLIDLEAGQKYNTLGNM